MPAALTGYVFKQPRRWVIADMTTDHLEEEPQADSTTTCGDSDGLLTFSL